ncbi:MAG: hypothetical protein HYY40_02190 [Bacteroidetes bacterium]|nr:hypothetical protein [Bacteroidota bacterium]
MNTQARKLNLIEYLLILQDEQILDKIETLLKPLRKNRKSIGIVPMTLEEFYSRNRYSQKEIAEGKLISHNDVKKHFERKGK